MFFYTSNSVIIFNSQFRIITELNFGMQHEIEYFRLVFSV